ncbi:Hpt domain-containing protein [Marinomonas sp. 2405UD66-6]|uniref:Hpt domain-containing protein n=1 Tax=Marinomonas sp. 2405UD66-6 TaxID=3391834 RepID=UPI0039C9D737
MLETKVFDYEDYKNRLASNRELMALVANEFILEATSLFERFQEAFVSQDWKSLDDLAHRLRGAGLEVSGHRFCLLIREIEISFEEGRSISSEVNDDLKNEFDNLISALQQEFSLSS